MNGPPAATARILGVLLLLIGASPFLADATIHTPGATRPAILDAIPTDESLLAVAVAHDESAAVAAYRSPGERTRSRILITRGVPDEWIERQVGGRVRALIWSADGSEILAIVHRPARRTDGSALLMRIDPSSGKARALMNLPPTAADLDHWIRPRSLLIAARNELRVILLDPPRSGPLYRVDGENLSVATLGGSKIVVVGQTDGMALLHLGDPPTDEGMPVRARVDLDAPALSIAPGPDGQGGLVHLADDSLLEYSVQPFATRTRGLALGLAASNVAPDLEPITLPLAPVPTAPTVVATEPAPVAPAPAVASPVTPEPTQEEPAESITPVAVPEPTPTPPAHATAPATPPPPPPVPADPPERQPPPRQLEGRLLGPAVDRVREIVLLGPDNLLREAVRVTPSADGAWSVDGLAPGRYRVQVDAGGGVVVVCRPPFLWIDLEAEPVRAPDIEVLRAF